MPLQSVQVYNILRSKDFSDEEAQLMAGAYEHNENIATRNDIVELKGDISRSVRIWQKIRRNSRVISQASGKTWRRWRVRSAGTCLRWRVRSAGHA